jgi:hypothetical protein
MFKVAALIVGGIVLMALGVYALSVTEFPLFNFPPVDWPVVGFVTIAGSIAVFGTAIIAARVN